MIKFAGLSGPEIVKALRRSNKLSLKTIQTHAIFDVVGSPYNISIPMHREVSRFLLKDQLRLAGISEDEFLLLLKKKR